MMTHLKLCAGQQEITTVNSPLVVEYEDDIYGNLHEDLSVSTATVVPNITDYEVGQIT